MANWAHVLRRQIDCIWAGGRLPSQPWLTISKVEQDEVLEVPVGETHIRHNGTTKGRFLWLLGD